MKWLLLEGSSHHTIVMTKINFAEGAEDTMSASKTKEEYIKLNSNDEKKFQEWSIKTKTIGTRKGWVKAFTEEDLKIDQKAADNAGKKAVMMNNLAYHHLVMSCMDKAFYYVQAAQDSEENGNAQHMWK